MIIKKVRLKKKKKMRKIIRNKVVIILLNCKTNLRKGANNE